MTGVTYNWDFSFLWMYRWLLLKGLGFTILYTIGSILLGLIVGLMVPMMADGRASRDVRRDAAVKCRPGRGTAVARRTGPE